MIFNISTTEHDRIDLVVTIAGGHWAESSMTRDDVECLINALLAVKYAAKRGSPAIERIEV